MKTITLNIYENNTINFKKHGALSKRAQRADGSFTLHLRDDEQFNWKTDSLRPYGYQDIRTGYVDNTLFLNKDNKQYVAFMDMKLENWQHAVSIGFSSHLS